MAQVLSKGVGIDLGTTNSAVAVMNPTDAEIVIHRDPVSRSQTTPSCVWKNPVSGEIVVGRMAFRRVGAAPPPIRSIKRSMGQQAKVLLTDEEVTAEQVSAAILAEMRRQIEQDVAAFDSPSTSWVVDRAIVTVPAYFDQPQIDATRRAGEMAGLEVLDLLHEPTAAACYHCWRTATRDGVFLVYDLGGGTFDASVVRCTAGAFEVLGISGNNRLGGDDIDTALATHLQESLIREGWALEPDTKSDPEDRLRFDVLKFLAEGVKKALAVSSEFLLRDSGTLKDKQGNPVVIEMMFERPDLDAIARPIVERTIPYCNEAIERAERTAGISLGDVDQVILAGGSTHLPLVRELVTSELCASPTEASSRGARARCTQPVYEKVDTIVALGAAIRAAALGGLTMYDQERTMRVSFRGTASTGAMTTRIGGRVEALAGGVDLDGGHVRLSTADYQDDAGLGQGGAFAFSQVPLQPGAESLLTFEVFDGGGRLLATAGRPVAQSADAGQRPTGGLKGTAPLAKAILLEVSRAGRPYLKELIPALASLPATEEYAFTHPGGTETVLFPVYQQKRKIQVIKVAVPSTTPRGTPIQFDLHIDNLSLITVKGSIGETPFDALVEPPPDRKMPTPAEVEALERGFRESLQYLPKGQRNVAEVRWSMAKQGFEAASVRGDELQAVHEFEEMEEIAAAASGGGAALEPPKERFDQLVGKCHELNDYVADAAAKAGKPHDREEIAKAIEVQAGQGERAFRASDQRSYADALLMLEGIRSHLVETYQTVAKIPDDTRSPGEKAADAARSAAVDATRVADLAAARNRHDLKDEAVAIRRQLAELERDAHRDPQRVQDQVGLQRGRLEQLWNVLIGRDQDDETEGKLAEDHSPGEQ